MNRGILKEIEQEYINQCKESKEVPEFRAGDVLKVGVRLIGEEDGASSRVQYFEGMCIARKNAGLGSSFTLRKVSYGVGVERKFPLYSPILASIVVVRRGVVRRAKLYYMRNLQGKATRIKERREKK